MKKTVSILLVFLMVTAFSSSLFGEEIKGVKQEMIFEKVSPYGMEETVKVITENAKSEKWVVSVKELDKSLEKSGGIKVLPVTLIELCHPDYAGKMLKDDNSRYISVMMPCTISVYEKSDGKTYVSFVNAGLVGNMFGGTVSEVMGGDVAEAQKRILNFLQ